MQQFTAGMAALEKEIRSGIGKLTLQLRKTIHLGFVSWLRVMLTDNFVRNVYAVILLLHYFKNTCSFTQFSRNSELLQKAVVLCSAKSN